MDLLTLPKPSAGRRTVTLPGDKSITHRALLLAAIAEGRTRVVDPNRGLDVEATIRALRQVGVHIARNGGDCVVVGRKTLLDPAHEVDCANSGTTMRLLLGLLAGRVNAILIGDESLSRRPMDRVAKPLELMGARVRTNRGMPPVALQASDAPLRGIRYVLPVASAQVKSAILFAALRAIGSTTITSPNQTRDHSERMARALGARISVRGKAVTIKPSCLKSPGQIRIPADFSAAVYFICAGALLPGCTLCLRNVGVNPTRTAALDILKKMGAQIAAAKRQTWSGEPVAKLTVTGGAPLHGVAVPARLVSILIDEIPALCALAASASGVFTVRGAAELKVKESNRIETTVDLLRRFGADARALSDGIVVRGGSRLRAPHAVSTHGDHRIGMAAAILAAAAQSPIRIEDSACIATSFPGFAVAWRKAFARS